jgi:hypothetical protein
MTETQTTSRATQATETYYANPYSLQHSGYYFTSLEEFEAGMDRLRMQGAEEVEIDYTDGDNYQLFAAAAVGQVNVGEWFALLDDVEDWQKPALFYLMDNLGETMSEALEHMDDVTVFQGTALDYAYELTEDTGMLDALPEQLRYYFDYAAFARDMTLNGEVTECVYQGTTYCMAGV